MSRSCPGVHTVVAYSAGIVYSSDILVLFLLFHVEHERVTHRKASTAQEYKHMAKLSRKQIREGLEQVPIDTVLLGVNSPVGKLTPKQREFARLVAMGETKAGAYREAYKSKGKAHTVAVTGHKMASRPDIQMTIDAYQAAIEAAKYRTPAQLRELVIHQLTQHALNDECPPAQRIKALELLGKVSEVAAFTERKETTVINQSSEIKQRLLESLKNVVDIEPNSQQDDGSSLLAELGQTVATSEPEVYPTPTPLSNAERVADSMHTTPHEQIRPNSTEQIHSDSDPQTIDENSEITPEEMDGEDETPTPSNMEHPPLSSEMENTGGSIFEESDENLR